jgi:hypothetical protein
MPEPEENQSMSEETSADVDNWRANDTVRGPGGLTALEWAMERFENSKRIAASKTDPEDQQAWAEDVWYWRHIVQALSPTFTLSERAAFGEWFSNTFIQGFPQGNVWLAWQAGAAWQKGRLSV